MMFRVLAIDIDGVLTDGKVTIDENGRELKTVSYQEASPCVGMIARRLEINHIYKGAKDEYQDR